jgi:hypothetical protein
MTQVVKDSFNGKMHGRPALAPARRQMLKPQPGGAFATARSLVMRVDLTAPFKANGTAFVTT